MNFPRVGDEFEARYHLERVLGEGGFARVFAAIETSLGRRVAIKVIKPGADGYGPGIRARFDREVRVIANLSDPHTVTVYDWGETPDGLLYMVFEYVAGQDLVELMDERGPIDEASAERIVRQVLASLREAHDHDLLHRDLKPHNIRIYEYGGDPLCAKLLDFGIAKPIEGGEEITTEGAVIGSPRYMAPEHLLNQPLGPPSDLYSLGLVLYEMLLGRDARRGSHLYDQLDRMKSGNALPVPPEAPVSPRMRNVLRKLLAVDPAKRFQTADQVLAALDGTDTAPTVPRARDATQIEPPRVLDRVTQPVPRPAPRPQPMRSDATQPSSPPSSTQLMPLAVLALLAVAALTGVVLWLMNEPDAPVQVPVARTVTPSADVPDAEPVVTEPRTGCGAPAPFVGVGPMDALDLLHRQTWGAYIPKSYDPDVAHEVLVYFHEDLDSFTRALHLSEFAEYADRHQLVILMPIDTSVRAWRGLPEVRKAARILELASEQLCLDTSRGVLAFGHGTGGRAAERLPCVTQVRAVATSAHRPEAGESFCEPARPIPYLHIAPLDDGYDPLDGIGGCGATKVSLDDLEARWRERNRCDGVESTTRPRGARCQAFACEERFVACRARGGHRWPGQSSRPADVQDCDGGEMTIPIAEVVWEFFGGYLEETDLAP